MRQGIQETAVFSGERELSYALLAVCLCSSQPSEPSHNRRLIFPGEGALGKRIQPNLAPPWFTVIGVARDVKNSDLASPSAPEYYFVRKHAADYGLGNRVLADGARYASMIIRSPLDHAAVSDWVRKEIAALDPTLPVQIDTMDLRVRQLEQQPRFNALLLALFAAIARVADPGPFGNFLESRFRGLFLGPVCQPAVTRFATRQLAQVGIGGPQWPDYSACRASTGFTDAARCAGI